MTDEEGEKRKKKKKREKMSTNTIDELIENKMNELLAGTSLPASIMEKKEEKKDKKRRKDKEERRRSTSRERERKKKRRRKRYTIYSLDTLRLFWHSRVRDCSLEVGERA